jgi:hypothetical protein
MELYNNNLFKAKLPPPFFILIKTATLKNYLIFFIVLIWPLSILYLTPSFLTNLSLGSLFIFLLLLSLSIDTLLRTSGLLSVLRLYKYIKKRKSLVDISGYISILPIFTLIPRHLEGGYDIPHLFIFSNPYEVNKNFIKEEIVSNGFNIYNAHDSNYFNPLLIAQPYSNNAIKNIFDGEAVRFIGNKKFGFIFTKNNIIWLKGKNVIYK